MPERTRPGAATAAALVAANGYASTPRSGAYPGSVPKKVAIWLRGHPREADGLLAAALLAFTAGQVVAGSAGFLQRGVFVVVTVVLAGTVAVRRQYPVGTFAVAAGIGVAQVALGVQYGGLAPVFPLQPTNADLAIPVMLYTLAAYRPRRVSIAGLLVCLLLSAVAIARWSPGHHAYAGGAVLVAAIGLGGLTVAAWVLGDSVAYRYRHAHYAVVEARAAQLEAERDAQARIAAAAERARELQERRAVAVDQSVARLRRIERDLHDGAQVRLAALAMMLGEVKENLEQADGSAGGDGQIRTLVTAAHRNAVETLVELRDLARGIHPHVLDRGLAAAFGSLADTVSIPVDVSVRTRERPSAAIEAIAYFCTAELLANITKHSGASLAAISVGDDQGRILITVTDNGDGGARLAPGGGLAGLRERVQTVDGHLGIDSPDGGPTTITIELPGHA
jgi:signal transduction histidine kinase